MQHQSKIIALIQDISVKDRERFYQFVHSPYFNQHDQTKELMDVILEYIDNPNRQLERKALFKRLFPEEKAYDEQKLHNVMSYLKKLYHRFLAVRFLEMKPFREQLFTLESAFEENQFDLMTNRAKLLEKQMDEHPHHNSDYHFVGYRVSALLGYYSGSYVDRSKTDAFQKMLDHLDRYYIVEKLRNCCHMTANMMLFNTNYDLGLLEEVLEYVENNIERFEQDTTILLYYTVLLTMRDESNPLHYERLKDMLTNNIDKLTPDEAYELYNFANNYCIRQIQQGNSLYQRELFNLYKQGLKADLLLTNGLISEWDYKNITTLGSNLKEFEWTEQFLQDYKDKLLASRRENAYNYNLANLYYNKKMFDKALEVLRDVQFTDVFYHLNTTFLQLRIYYDQRDTEAFMGLIETFRIYVIRNRKLTTAEKKGYTNLLRLAKNLAQLKHNASTFTKKAYGEKMLALRKKIEETPNVINKQWLLEECKV